MCVFLHTNFKNLNYLYFPMQLFLSVMSFYLVKDGSYSSVEASDLISNIGENNNTPIAVTIPNNTVPILIGDAASFLDFYKLELPLSSRELFSLRTISYLYEGPLFLNFSPRLEHSFYSNDFSLPELGITFESKTFNDISLYRSYVNDPSKFFLYNYRSFTKHHCSIINITFLNDSIIVPDFSDLFNKFKSYGFDKYLLNKSITSFNNKSNSYSINVDVGTNTYVDVLKKIDFIQ